MAAAQRKLVHKQFNSPMGLYSQDNVRATLDRELRAIGDDGIEIDEQISKSLNLANSEVLRAVTEEDKKSDPKYRRESRSKERSLPRYPHYPLHQHLLDEIKSNYMSHQHDIVVDRDAVLKINKLRVRKYLRSRDHSWPPSSEVRSADKTRSQDNKQLEESTRCSSHDNVIHFGLVVCKQHSIDAVRDKFKNSDCTPTQRPNVRKKSQRLWQRALQEKRDKSGLGSATADESSSNESKRSKADTQTVTEKRNKPADNDFGLVRPKLEYYEHLTQLQEIGKIAKGRQSHSLDRGRAANRNSELPPLKPRAASANARVDGSKPQLQRRAIKLATEIKIFYEPDVNRQPQPIVVDTQSDVPIKSEPIVVEVNDDDDDVNADEDDHNSTSNDIDFIENMPLPLPPPPPVASRHVEREPNDTTGTKTPVRQFYDDTCIYLRSMDSLNHTVAYIPAAISIIPTTPTDRTLQASQIHTKLIKIPRNQQPTHSSRPTESAFDGSCKPSRVQVASLPRQKLELPPTCDTHSAAASAETNYDHIQQSITAHLRQIDAYIESAKNALQLSAAHKQSADKVEKTVELALQTHPVKIETKTTSTINSQTNRPLQKSPTTHESQSPLTIILNKVNKNKFDVRKTASSMADNAAEYPFQTQPPENLPAIERVLSELKLVSDSLPKRTDELLSVEPTSAAKEGKSKEHFKKNECHIYINEGDNLGNVADADRACKRSKKVKPVADRDLTTAMLCKTCNADTADLQLSQENLSLNYEQGESFETYKSSYEMPSTFSSRQVSWEASPAILAGQTKSQFKFAPNLTANSAPDVLSSFKSSPPTSSANTWHPQTGALSEIFADDLQKERNSAGGIDASKELQVREEPIVNRKFDNISPRPYMNIEGYKRVAWPPASEERIIREFTPQPAASGPAQNYDYQQPQNRAQYNAPSNVAPAPVQGPIYNNVQRYHQNENESHPSQYQSQSYNETNRPNQQEDNRSYPHNAQPLYNQHNAQPLHNQPVPPNNSYYGYGPANNLASNQGSQNQYPYAQYDFPNQQQQFQQPPQTYAPLYDNYHQQQQQQQPKHEPSHYVQQQQQREQLNQLPPKHLQHQTQQPIHQPANQAPFDRNVESMSPANYSLPKPQQQQQQPYQVNRHANQSNFYPQQQQPPINQTYADQADYQSPPQVAQFNAREPSPGIMTLRKEVPVTQKPSEVYASQPAAVSYQGGSKMRGDLKWPPEEYKVAAARENEERRLLALGPVCRPRKVKRDYTSFFAKHALNSTYASYKVPPGTQHMLA